MPKLDPSTIVLWIVIPLIVWRLYSRVRRHIGRQRLSRVRPWLTVTLFPLLILLLAGAALAHPDRLAWLAGGLALGVALGRAGLRHTRFEATPEGFYYTPNAHLGILVSLLLVGRIGYRFYQLATLDPAQVQNPADFARSPATLGIFGVLAAYYVSYAIGLLRWRQGAPRGAAPANG